MFLNIVYYIYYYVNYFDFEVLTCPSKKMTSFCGYEDTFGPPTPHDDPFLTRLFLDLPEAPVDASSFARLFAELPEAPTGDLLAECPSNDSPLDALLAEFLAEFHAGVFADDSFFPRILGECKPMLLPNPFLPYDPFLPFMGSPDSEMTTPDDEVKKVKVKQEPLYTTRRVSGRIAGKRSKQEIHREVYFLTEKAQSVEKAQKAQKEALRKAKSLAQAQPQPLNAQGCL